MDTDERLDLLQDAVRDLRIAWDNLDPEPGMRALASANRHGSEIAVALVEQGVQAGMSQRAIAQALEVPESALRGARREFSRS